MKRIASWLILLPLALAGCHNARNPGPKMDFFAGYGSSTVPPPATGSYGSSRAPYYPQSGATSQANPAGENPPVLAQTPGWQVAGQPAPSLAVADNNVVVASHNSEAPIRIVDSPVSAPPLLASQTQPPQLFVPPAGAMPANQWNQPVGTGVAASYEPTTTIVSGSPHVGGTLRPLGESAGNTASSAGWTNR